MDKRTFSYRPVRFFYPSLIVFTIENCNKLFRIELYRIFELFENDNFIIYKIRNQIHWLYDSAFQPAAGQVVARRFASLLHFWHSGYCVTVHMQRNFQFFQSKTKSSHNSILAKFAYFSILHNSTLHNSVFPGRYSFYSPRPKNSFFYPAPRKMSQVENDDWIHDLYDP